VSIDDSTGRARWLGVAIGVAVLFPVAQPLAWSISPDPGYLALSFAAVLHTVITALRL
jgi:hypothetical protein